MQTWICSGEKRKSPHRTQQMRGTIMSLDLVFTGKEETHSCECPKCGNVHENIETEYESFNITHNLAPMADSCGLYGPLWQPSTEGIETSGDLIKPIEKGLDTLRSDPEKFRPLSASNGWGTYDQFINWLEKVLEFCRENEEMKVRASR